MAKKRANGEGSICGPLSDGRWKWEKTIGVKRAEDGSILRYEKGKSVGRPIPQKVILYAASQSELLDKIRQRERQEDTNTVVVSSKITVAQWFAFWFKNYCSELRAKTKEQYSYIIRLYINPNIGFIELKELTSDHLIKLYSDMKDNGKSPRLRQLTYVIVGKALQDACNCTPPKIPINPNKSVRPIRVERKEAEHLTMEQQERLQTILDSKISKYALMCVVALAGGMRKGEIVALRDADLDFKNNRIRINKTLDRAKNFDKEAITKTIFVENSPKSNSGNRLAEMPVSVMVRLKEFIDNRKVVNMDPGQQYVFCTPDGSHIEPSHFSRALKRYAKAAGLDKVKIHMLRHTYATRQLELGTSINAVSKQLGHSKPSVTSDIYQHVESRLQREAADRINHLFEKKVTEAVHVETAKVVEIGK